MSAAPLLFNEEAAAATPTPIELPDLELPEKRGVEPPRAIPRSLPTIASTPSRAPALESTIDAEMRLLTDAQAANQAGDPRRALQLLDEFALRFPASRLTDVRTVARLVALCKVGQADLARREAARFLAKYPNSPFQDRVRGICASKVKP